MAITFGTPEDKIPEASIKDLLHALTTPDGCGSKKKLLAIKYLLSYERCLVEQEIETYINRGEVP